uniref:Uncharacterized protein n=1 Tax=Parascaris equorum TaxID=6256 RepID=A0A914RVI4_PAREQ
MLHFDAVDGRCYPRHGLASDWLASLRLGDHVKVSVTVLQDTEVLFVIH